MFSEKRVRLCSMAVIAVMFCGVFRFRGDLFSDYRKLYTNAKQTAAEIEKLPEDAVIVESSEDFCNAIIPYLKTKQIINPFIKTVASYTCWNSRLRHSMEYEDFEAWCRETYPERDEIYLVYNEKANSIKNLDVSTLTPVYETEGSLLTSERYSIFRFPLAR